MCTADHKGGNARVQKANKFERIMDLSQIQIKATGRGVSTLDAESIDMSVVLDLIKIVSDGELVKPVPYADVKDVGHSNLNLVMQMMALYTFPTVELIDFLRNEIDDGDPEFAPDAIEICAGSGWIGRSLDIPMTDSYLQQREDVKQLYLDNGCMPIKYPSDVEKLDAVSAIKKYDPEFVIGSYVTRKWGLGSRREGNMYGVDTGWVVNNCHKFYLIGNENVHSGDPIMKRNHKTLCEEWLITRGDKDKARIWVWENKMWR